MWKQVAEEMEMTKWVSLLGGEGIIKIQNKYSGEWESQL